MLLHNITFNVENNIHDQWLNWMRNNFVPAVMATKLPRKSLIMRLLTEIDNNGMTYSFQFYFEEMEDFMSYEMNFRSKIMNDMHQVFQGKYVMFSTLLEEV
jgi:hypothetical protein